MTDVAAISLWQPWASLWAQGSKIDETRHWPAPARLIGKPLLIHAAKRRIPKWELEATVEDPLFQICAEVFGSDWPTALPYGAFVGGGILDLCMQHTLEYAEEMDRRRLRGDRNAYCGNFAPDRWSWRLRDAYRFLEPVEATGRQGLWTEDSSRFAGREMLMVNYD